MVEFETTVREGVLRVRREGARWLSTGWGGGERRGDAAYNVSVPEGFDRTDLDAYLAERRQRAGFGESGPCLLTGVELRHARGARCGPVSAIGTAGVSNPAALPMVAASESADASADSGAGGERAESASDADSAPEIGTVNVLVGTHRALADGALANLLAVAVETKTATLLAETGFPGTTSDAVVAACDPAGEEVAFTGSATEVGACARACVREAVRAALDSRYGDRTDDTIPASVADADHGVVTDRRAVVFKP
ncbi:adenosylcobinamide amidohydrolase [Halorussus caseinilyticus]|uniref:adenosylcobinamide amidohydrolase n=1 Tax=Halorussus caseinilyticus TaxID=3034025 RepID=UPI0023E88803|nr:adenosylcobinamide amidohydrolase [Halorussus sp. DT72]